MKEIKNNSLIEIRDIPIYSYALFYEHVDLLMQQAHNHCVNYFAFFQNNAYQCICCIANDITAKIYVLSHLVEDGDILESITAKHYAMHAFEREIHENFGIQFSNHPWLKPLRYSANRFNKQDVIENYPFYTIQGEDLHEVGVGPIHAGVIEPGHFRFICNGEKVLHLEIMLGYQHRGLERLMVESPNQLRKNILAESIAGDTVIGHSVAYTSVVENLANVITNDKLQFDRTIALELERIAMHIGDTSALCADIAYQLGQVGCEALRTIVINTMQAWCGNRFSKGFIRPLGSNYPLTKDIARLMLENLNDVERRYLEIMERVLSLPSVLSRFEDVGVVTARQANLVGLVGMAARMTRVKRDIRSSHPFLYYPHTNFEPLLYKTGDVLARVMLRKEEVEQSVQLIRSLLNRNKNLLTTDLSAPNYNLKFTPDSFTISLVEGWRGEICHVALTDADGNLAFYKVKDPSFHNWMGLALAVRNQEISDFPICNKSFNLSYCGHDL